MTTQDITLRLIIITLISGIIGYEREKQNANAGLRTHLLVGITATILALIQQAIIKDVLTLYTTTNIEPVIRADPSRLIAQVISGIGFLGAGTIIVTKRNVSGLTTAASIWSVSGLGLAIGMGYYEIGLIGFIFLFLTLAFLRRLYRFKFHERIYIEYIGGSNTIEDIESIFQNMNLTFTHQSFKARPFGNELIYGSVFEIEGSRSINFEKIISKLSTNDKIASAQLTNID